MEKHTKRNDPCPCGSGKKFKKCCIEKSEMPERKEIPKQSFRSFFNVSSFILDPNFKLNVLRKMEYKGTFVYVFQYHTMFQYLFAWHNEIYQDHLFLKPRFYKKILAMFGKSLYTQDELEYGEGVCLQGAIKSIDALGVNPAIAIPDAEKIPLNK